MSEYSNLVEAFHKLFFQAMQVFERELDTPIVITSRVEGGGHSLSLRSLVSILLVLVPVLGLVMKTS